MFMLVGGVVVALEVRFNRCPVSPTPPWRTQHVVFTTPVIHPHEYIREKMIEPGQVHSPGPVRFYVEHESGFPLAWLRPYAASGTAANDVTLLVKHGSTLL